MTSNKYISLFNEIHFGRIREINKYLWGTETWQTLSKHHINGGAATDDDWIITVVPLTGQAHLLLFFERLYSTHSVHTSQSHSLCCMWCETYVVGDIISWPLQSNLSSTTGRSWEWIYPAVLKYFNNLCPDCSLQQDRYYERNWTGSLTGVSELSFTHTN